MAVTPPAEVANKPMIAVDRVERFSCKQAMHNDLEFFKILASTLATFEIL